MALQPGTSAYDAVIAITVILLVISTSIAGYYGYIWYRNRSQSVIAFEKWVRGSTSASKGMAPSGLLNADNSDVLIVENPMMKRNSVSPNSTKNDSHMMTKVGDDSSNTDSASNSSVRRLSAFFAENNGSPIKRGSVRGPTPNNVAVIRRSSMSGNNNSDTTNDEIINVPSIFIPAIDNESTNKRMSKKGETPVKVNLKTAQDDL